jgi:KDO2-lipid IV(A) lauroyltransferase
LGTLVGLLAYAASPTYRRTLSANLTRALGPRATAARRAAAAQQAGCMALELPALWGRPPATVLGWVREVRGLEYVQQAQARGGIVFITPHLGSFEIAGQYCASLGPLTALYRAPRHASLSPLMQAGRQRGGMKLAPADLAGVRALLKALKRGENVGLLPDQVPQSGEGVWADFFGTPAFTMTLASRLMHQPAVTPLLVWAERLPCGRGFRVHFSSLPSPKCDSPAMEARALNAALESLILRCPEQYLWGYNRYKRPAGVGSPGAHSC